MESKPKKEISMEIRFLLRAMLVAVSGFIATSALAQPPGSKTGAIQVSFETALKTVMDAEPDNFQAIKGKDGNIPDKTGSFPIASLCCGYPRYYVKTTLPGFSCGLLGELTVPKDRPPRLHYLCRPLGVGGYMTPELKSAYDNLVEKVKLATGLPYITINQTFSKTETQPGSGVFERDHITLFSRYPSQIVVEHYISVSLVGLPGLRGRWLLELQVGTEWPDI
jgi:hypothetical protein